MLSLRGASIGLSALIIIAMTSRQAGADEVVSATEASRAATTPATETTSPWQSDLVDPWKHAPKENAPRGHTIRPWLVVGTGAAGVVSGLVVVLTAPALPDGCSSSTSTCQSPGGGRSETTAQRDELAARQSQAGAAVSQPPVGYLLVGVGAATVAAGLIWHFLERTEPRVPSTSRVSASSSPSVVPWAASGGGGVVTTGTF